MAPRSIISFRRKGRERVGARCFRVQPHACSRVRTIGSEFRRRGEWRELLNSDAPLYGGSGQGNAGAVHTSPVPMHGHPVSVNLTLPPLAMIALKKA